MDKIRADQPLPSDPNMHVMWRRRWHRQYMLTSPRDFHRAGPAGGVRAAAPSQFGATLTRFAAPGAWGTKGFLPRRPWGAPGGLHVLFAPAGR